MEKPFRWNKLKNEKLKQIRGADFKDVTGGQYIGFERHPSRSNQVVLFYWYKNYVWVIPSVEERESMFLKTMYPSRKYTKIFGGRYEKEV